MAVGLPELPKVDDDVFGATEKFVMNEFLAADIFSSHAHMMYHRERYLQHLQQKFKEWVPWLEQACGGDVGVANTGPGFAFTVIVRWKEGADDKEFRRLYNQQNIGDLRAGCLKPYAREIIMKVLEMKGKL